MEAKKTTLIRTVFGMMINPAGVLKNALKGTKWYFSIGVSALAFGLFFIQTGLDLYKTGQKGFWFVLFCFILGLLYGLLAIPFFATVIWLLLKVSKADTTILETISAFCLSYSGALIYGVIGIVFSIALGWNTSVAFGVTGVLWAIGPMMYTIRELTGGNHKLSIPISSLVGVIVLLSWSTLGRL
ncbi:hypothetical protein [Petrocella sp. FN5]|uniref:hypothetical protein n=1 Tax=Petrocella sp. FN5 TaxID=3032002 RepID=UPI0023DC26EC|nr:hypothetical protein [Petrocella sp. FN5]MDF1617198.1 hypothetical protein [Petrocella sp. FN5]